MEKEAYSVKNMPTMPAEDTLQWMEDNLQSAPISCNNWPAVSRQTPDCSFAAGYNKESLCVLFDCKNIEGFRAEHTADLDAVCEDTCVEIFIRHASDPYWNFEVNSRKALNASYRMVRSCPTRLTADMLASVVRHSVVSADRRNWKLLLMIPLDIFGPSLPHSFTANLYATSSKSEKPYYLSYAPISTDKPDFHRTEFFADFSFER